MKNTKKTLLAAALLTSLFGGLASFAPAASAQVIIAPGWHGDRYYDGHRYWERREWERRHHHRHWDHR
ncbi:MAG: hypothetical protein ACRYG5_19050 [Janthinobacterium lividum]